MKTIAIGGMTLLAALAAAAGAAALDGGKRQAGGAAGGTAVVRNGELPTQGSGRLARVERALPEFEAIDVDDAASVEISFGPSHLATIEADDNLIGRVETVVEGGTLRIGVGGSYRTRTPPVVRIVMPALERIDLHASGRAGIAGMRGPRLSLSSDGSGSFSADGEVGRLDVELSGSGNADLAALRAEEVRVALNGSGRASVNAARYLKAEVNGSGDIRYRGTPAHLERAVHGTGSIRAFQR